MYQGAGSALPDLGSMFATSLGVTFALWLAIFAASCLVWYLIIKTAVRDGMVAAHKRTGGFGGGGTTSVQGYPPPAEGYGAPLPPSAAGR